jgi:hypothetical protein
MPPKRPDPEFAPPDPARKAGRAMARSLKNLLDKVPGSREVLPYLAALERALSADGTACSTLIPLSSLRRMSAPSCRRCRWRPTTCPCARCRCS